MPGPPNAVNKTRRQDVLQKDSKTDIGRQAGEFDTPNIRQKVRTWQVQGGGVIHDDDDVIVVEHEDENVRRTTRKEGSKKTPTKGDRNKEALQDRNTSRRSPTKPDSTFNDTPPRIRTPKETGSEKKASAQRKDKPQNDLDDEMRHVGAPKKRVISDGHWRKDKDRTSPKKAEATPEPEQKPSKIKRTVVFTDKDPVPAKYGDDDGIRAKPSTPKRYDDNDGIRVRPKEHVLTGRPHERSHYSPTTSSKDRPRTPADSSRPTSKGASEKSHSGPDRDSDSSAKRNRKPARRNISPSNASIETSSIIPDDSISTRNGRGQKPRKDTREKVLEELSSRRAREPDLPRERAPEPLDHSPTPVPPKVYANRIEAWLTAAPGDPDDTIPEVSSRDDHCVNSARGEKSRKFSYETSAYDRDRDSHRDGKQQGAPRTNIVREDEETCASSATSSVAPTEINLPEDKFKKHSPGANLKRHFPSTGRHLSTIASVETFQTREKSPVPSEISEQATVVPEDSAVGSDAGVKRSNGSGLKRRLTRHDDLMSVLSLPRADTKSMMSTRSVRASRSRREKLTAKELWDELTEDEAKYQRELRTVVDGVIPVLLSCVLSKSDSAMAAGLFGRTSPSDTTVTKPIVDMGVALERLKAHHKRIPKSEESALFTWAQNATRIYTDYLKAWRMGFQDVVVNLAPVSGSTRTGWDDGLLKNGDGDLVNIDGERVDVAFLLKRPLVRLKLLAKTFKGFNQVLPSASASATADKYQQLVVDARKRSNEERARLEDEAAASIDPKRARDPRSLAPLAGVSIDATRYVRARDYFDMELRHSSGQQLDCKIEMVLRDDAPDRGDGGDVLFCEVSDTGRWLLFPPVRQDLVSARNDDSSGEIVVMIRGLQSNGQEWHELLSLHANEDEAGPEWVHMLGLEPAPPKISRAPSFLTPPARPGASHATPKKASSSSLKSGSPSLKDVEVPIGEVAGSESRTWDGNATHISTDVESEVSLPRQSGTVHRKPLPSKVGRDRAYNMPNSPLRELFSSIDSALNDGAASPSAASLPGLKRAKAKKYKSSPVSPPLSDVSSSSYTDHPAPLRPIHSRTQPEVTWMSNDSTSSHKKDFSVWLPSSTLPSDESESESEEEKIVYKAYNPPHTPTRPSVHRKTSSVPSSDLPAIPRLRESSRMSPPQRDEETHNPSSAPAKLQKRPKGSNEPGRRSAPESPAPPQKKRFSIPSLTPNFLKRNRRSSSPLKHQYEPSVVSDSSSYSISSDDEDFDDSLTSESSDEEHDIIDLKAPMFNPAEVFSKATPPDSVASLPENTLAPSQSASQSPYTPYRTIPQPAGGASRTVASIFGWSDRGAWESLHPEECSVIVTGGLIEAFEMNTSPPTSSGDTEWTSPSTRGFKPIVAFELTPLVPLRRGTALDISIRSPPTVNSLIRTSNNVMFRSRNAEECESLYSLINHARINNPTYVALQNARGPFNESTWAAAMERRNSGQKPKSSWFPTRKSSTYRSKASRPRSINTDSSVGTNNSAFSALRRFSGSSNIFNIGKSTITSRQGSHSATSDSLSSGSSSTPLAFDLSQGTPLGITNAKIRLHYRETATKWRDMGSARLTIMIPPRPNPNVPASPRTTGLEKRILVQGKTHGETLLDVTLGESCFERVARTGIAVSVWEDNMGPNGELGHVAASGGVGSSRARTFMIQLKSERECAYTFGLVGKLRY